jgi:DNA-binding MarR family transcriptional regulator
LEQLDSTLSIAVAAKLEHPTMGLLLRLLYQLYSLEIQGALRQAGFHDINPAAANVFTFLTPEGATVSELAELSHVRKQTMAQTVEQLERSGYVERLPNPRDRRSQLVFLTAHGERIPQVTHKAAAAVEKRWARLSGPDQLEALRMSLLDLLSRLTTE